MLWAENKSIHYLQKMMAANIAIVWLCFEEIQRQRLISQLTEQKQHNKWNI